MRARARELAPAAARNSREWAFVHLPGWRMPHAIDREGGTTFDARALADLSAAQPVVRSDRDGAAGGDGAAHSSSARVGPGALRRQRRARGRDGGGGRA